MLKVTQPESGCTGFMQLIKDGGGWRCRRKGPSTRGREENASSGEGAAGDCSCHQHREVAQALVRLIQNSGIVNKMDV